MVPEAIMAVSDAEPGRVRKTLESSYSLGAFSRDLAVGSRPAVYHPSIDPDLRDRFAHGLAALGNEVEHIAVEER
jgi:hypothetical protein